MKKHKIPFIIASKCTENEIIFLELVLNSKWNEAKSFFQNIEKMRNSCNIISHLFYCCLSAYVCDRWWNGLLICKILPQSEKDGFLSILQFLLDKGAEINRINIAETPLFPASISLQPFLVSFLLQKGASPQILSTSNRSVLSRVYFKFAREICWNRRKKYIHELIKMGTEVLVLLIEHGATTRKSYGFGSFKSLELALYHTLGDLPEPEITHRFW